MSDLAPVIPITARCWATAVPTWTVEAFGGKALRLYMLLLGTAQRDQRKSRHAGPLTTQVGRQEMATAMGWSRPQTVDRYLNELVDGGGISKTPTYYEDGARIATTYTVHLDPPAGGEA